MITDHIVIGDAHARPDVPNDRFTWMGNFVRDYIEAHRDHNIVVIEMGDWEDMESLSSYDMGKKSYEGRRYKRDLEAAWDAREKFIAPIRRSLNPSRSSGKRKGNVSFYALGGNHFEGRILRVIEATPLLDGTISVEDGRHKEFGWEYVPFLEPLTVNGVTYVHYWQGRGTGQPIASGKAPARTLLREKHCSTVVGHNHISDVASEITASGDRIWGVSAGCALDPSQIENYAKQNNKDWYRCINVFRDVHNGDFRGGYEIIPMSKLKEWYGK